MTLKELTLKKKKKRAHTLVVRTNMYSNNLNINSYFSFKASPIAGKYKPNITFQRLLSGLQQQE